LDDFYAHESDITAEACRENAQRFATARFDRGITEVLGVGKVSPGPVALVRA
jgi:hypothetical protein